jgi:hypothetical protein
MMTGAASAPGATSSFATVNSSSSSSTSSNLVEGSSGYPGLPHGFSSVTGGFPGGLVCSGNSESVLASPIGQTEVGTRVGASSVAVGLTGLVIQSSPLLVPQKPQQQSSKQPRSPAAAMQPLLPTQQLQHVLDDTSKCGTTAVHLQQGQMQMQTPHHAVVTAPITNYSAASPHNHYHYQQQQQSGRLSAAIIGHPQSSRVGSELFFMPPQSFL